MLKLINEYVMITMTSFVHISTSLILLGVMIDLKLLHMNMTIVIYNDMYAYVCMHMNLVLGLLCA